MFTGSEITATLSSLGVTHVVWLPDSEIGKWETDLVAASELALVRVCREGEAWAIAAGLHLGGMSPVVMIQTTGMFESSDTMRNVLFDLRLPIFAIVGARNWLKDDSRDSAKLFAEPFLKCWGLDYVVIARPQDKPLLAEHYQRRRHASQPGVALIAEESQ